MQVLLDRGADPNARDNDDSALLHQSSWLKDGVYGRPCPHCPTCHQQSDDLPGAAANQSPSSLRVQEHYPISLLQQ